MQARTHRRLEPFEASVAQLRRYFGLLLSQRKPPTEERTTTDDEGNP
jgi:hypothetical protein